MDVSRRTWKVNLGKVIGEGVVGYEMLGVGGRCLWRQHVCCKFAPTCSIHSTLMQGELNHHTCAAGSASSHSRSQEPAVVLNVTATNIDAPHHPSLSQQPPLQQATWLIVYRSNCSMYIVLACCTSNLCLLGHLSETRIVMAVKGLLVVCLAAVSTPQTQLYANYWTPS